METKHFIVPQWYSDAVQSGIPEQELKEKIKIFALEGIQRRALRDGQPKPEHVAPEVVELLYNMYTQAIEK